jgi:hypothetical protein
MDSQTDPTVLAASRFPKFHHKHLEEVTLNQLDGHWSLKYNQRDFSSVLIHLTKEKNPKTLTSLSKPAPMVHNPLTTATRRNRPTISSLALAPSRT